MKFLLALLLSFMLMEAPVLAIHGGYELGTSTSVTGTYAGVMIPTQDNILSAGATDFGTNSLGLFTLSIPSTGLAAGASVIFSNGRTFTGTIQGVANPDPNSPGVIGILSANFTYSISVLVSGTLTSESFSANAQGSFDASAVNDAESVGGNGVDLSGTSLINVDEGFVTGSNGTPIVVEQVTFDIEGFQQSTSATTSGG